MWDFLPTPLSRIVYGDYGVEHLGWKKPVPFWSLLVGILLAVSLTVALLVVPSLLAPRPNFSLVVKSNNIIVTAFNCNGGTSPCNSNSTSLTVNPIMNFTGIVTLSASVSNPGIDVIIGYPGVPLVLPANVLLGPAADLRLAVESAIIGNYTITVTASSGPIIHTLVVPVAVQNVTFALSATSLTVARGSTGSLQMDMTSVNRSAGNLTMKGTVIRGSFGVDPYSNVSFTPHSLLLQPGASARTTVTVSVGTSAATGTRGVALTVNKGAYTFTLTMLLTVT